MTGYKHKEAAEQSLILLYPIHGFNEHSRMKGMFGPVCGKEIK